MKTGKTVITLGYDERQEVEPGVFETQELTQTVKATEESIFARRTDLATRDGITITARFSVKENLVTDTFKYAVWHKQKYKLHSVMKSVTTHETIVELGGRI